MIAFVVGDCGGGMGMGGEVMKFCESIVRNMVLISIRPCALGRVFDGGLVAAAPMGPGNTPALRRRLIAG